MQIKKALRDFALKALGASPVMGAGLLYTFGDIFTWLGGGTNAIDGYNNKIMYSGMNLLVKKLTEVPVIVSKVENRKALKSFYKISSPERLHLNKAVALTELYDHELGVLLNKPNSYQSGIELMDQFWHNWLFGDGYLIALSRDGEPGAESRSFKPTELHAINRNRVTPIKSYDRFNPIKEYRLTLQNGEQLTLYPDQVLHMPRWNPIMGQMQGYSLMNAAGMTVSKDEASEIAQGAAFNNGGRGTIFSSELTKDGDGQMVEMMTAEQMSALKETMQSDFAGARNNRRMHYTNGYVNVQNYGDTLAEMELVESGKATWKDGYTMLGIPIVLGPSAEAMTESNVIAGYKALVTNTIIPDLRRFDQKFNLWVKRWFGEGISVNHDITEFSELTADYKLLKEIYGDAPYLTPNEKRKLFNFDTDEVTPGMSGYYFPTTLTPLSKLISDDFDQLDNTPGKQYDYNS